MGDSKNPFGKLEMVRVESRALQGNHLNDPHIREIAVYLPADYGQHKRKYPVIYLLPAHARTHHYYIGWNQYEETLVQRLDRLIAMGRMPPVLVVLPDFWTRFGGAQFINSPIGDYETYLIEEIIPTVDAEFQTKAQREHRAIMGHSSGGYGALLQAMRHPELFCAVAAKAPDAYMEYTALPALSRFHSQLSKFGGIAEFIAQIPTIHPKTGAFWEAIHTAMYCMAYAPNPASPLGFDMPIDEETGALIPAVWERWLKFDLVRLIEDTAHQKALRQMSLIFLEVGTHDEYNLQVGARLLHKRWQELAIPHEYEEFPDGHRSTSYRFDVSLPKLAGVISG